MSRVAPLVILDLDDTLIESFSSYVRLHRRIAEDVGLPVPTAEQLVEYGPTWEATVARVWPERDLRPFFRRYEEIADSEVYRAFDGVPEMLADLRAGGHSLWIVSKRSRLRMGMRLSQAGLAEALFDGIFADEDLPASKPDPRCFEPVWGRVGGRRPAIYVGDRHDDRAAATAAGLPFVAVKTGPEATFGSFPDDHPPEHTLDSAADLPAWLERHGASLGSDRPGGA